jgi:hypothetical protein
LDFRRYLRPQDFVWLTAFAATAIFSPYRDPRVLLSLAALAVLRSSMRVSRLPLQSF